MDIQSALGVAKSTLSYWFKNSPDSQILKKKLILKSRKKARRQIQLMAAANRRRWKETRIQWRKTAAIEYQKMKLQALFCIGLALYWGEGDKKLENGIVRLGNTDDRLLRLFILFLKGCCNVPLTKLRVWLLLYPDSNEKTCQKFWTKKLGVQPQQFMKSQRVARRGVPRKLINYGVCYVYVCSRELKEKITHWIQLANDENTLQAGIV